MLFSWISAAFLAPSIASGGPEVAGVVWHTHQLSGPVYASVIRYDVMDVDGDGFADLIYSRDWDGTYEWLRSLGRGQYDDACSLLLPARAVGSLAVADVDGDGDDDLFVGSSVGGSDTSWGDYGSLALLINKGGQFEISKNLGSFTPSQILASDWNGDSRMDVIFGGYNEGGYLALGPTFSETENHFGLWPTYMSKVDLDGDGNLDLAYTTHDHHRVGNLRLYAVTPRGLLSVASLDERPTGIRTVGAFADVNGDGFQDVLGAPHLNDEPGIYVFDRLDDGTFGGPRLWYAGATPVDGGDLDGDGDGDVIAMDGDSGSQIFALYNDGGELSPGPPMPWYGSRLDLRDLDRDGDPDLLVGTRSGPVAILTNMGPDLDSDGLGRDQELRQRTDPVDPDTDGDGVLDGVDPCLGEDASGDIDGDGLCARAVGGGSCDLDDGDRCIRTTGYEACNGVDDDCDGRVDEGCGVVEAWPCVDWPVSQSCDPDNEEPAGATADTASSVGAHRGSGRGCGCDEVGGGLGWLTVVAIMLGRRRSHRKNDA